MAALDDSPLTHLRHAITEALLALERGDGPLPRLAAAREVRRLAEELELRAIADARAERASWAKIGTIYGLTKQGAQQRFGDRLPAPASDTSDTRPE